MVPAFAKIVLLSYHDSMTRCQGYRRMIAFLVIARRHSNRFRVQMLPHISFVMIGQDPRKICSTMSMVEAELLCGNNGVAARCG